MKNRIIAFALTTFSIFAFAGPFGLDMGMTTDQIRAKGIVVKADPKSPGWYETITLPKTLDAFEGYRLWIEEGVGLCKIQAFGNTIRINSFGSQLRQEFDRVEQLLSSTYGKQERYDFLKRGSIWSEPNEWTMALLKEERTLTSYWSQSSGSNMKDEVESIGLRSWALTLTSGYIDLVYDFTNVDNCIAKSNARKKGVL